MKIVVLGDELSWNEITSSNNDINWVRATDENAFLEITDADAYFYLAANPLSGGVIKTNKPVFIHSVDKTLSELKYAQNIVRMNAWPGFIQRPVWEVAGLMSKAHTDVLNSLGKKIVQTPDEPGLISARIIAMIINEAFFAKGEHVSTESEIDIAMKLGTNYPLGPFEWAEKIGVKNIYALLLCLSKNDPRYTAAPLLEIKAIAP